MTNQEFRKNERFRKFDLIIFEYKEIGNQKGVAEKLGMTVADVSKVINLDNRPYGTNIETHNPSFRLIKPSITSDQLSFLDKYNI